MEFGVFDHLDRTGQMMPDFYLFADEVMPALRATNGADVPLPLVGRG